MATGRSVFGKKNWATRRNERKGGESALKRRVGGTRLTGGRENDSEKVLGTYEKGLLVAYGPGRNSDKRFQRSSVDWVYGEKRKGDSLYVRASDVWGNLSKGGGKPQYSREKKYDSAKQTNLRR